MCGVVMSRFVSLMAVSGVVSLLSIPHSFAAESESRNDDSTDVSAVPLRRSPKPATTVKEWQAQIANQQVQITDVQVTGIEGGVAVTLAASETLAVPETSVTGNTLIAEIPNAVLSLPNGEAFQTVNPAAGIIQVSVTSLPGDQVRVEVVGTDAPPVAEVTTAEAGLVFAVTPGTLADTEDAGLEITVTAERGDEGYSPSNATTATKTDTPLRDIRLPA